MPAATNAALRHGRQPAPALMVGQVECGQLALGAAQSKIRQKARPEYAETTCDGDSLPHRGNPPIRPRETNNERYPDASREHGLPPCAPDAIAPDSLIQGVIGIVIAIVWQRPLLRFGLVFVDHSSQQHRLHSRPPAESPARGGAANRRRTAVSNKPALHFGQRRPATLLYRKRWVATDVAPTE